MQKIVKRLRQRIIGGGPADRNVAVEKNQSADGHLVAREGSGLVRAQDRGRTQRFDGRRSARQHPVLGKPPRSHRHEDGQDEQELLRQHRHRHGDAGQRAAQPVVVRPDIESRHDQADREPERREPADQLACLAMKRRGLGLDGAERLSDAADFAARPRCDDLGEALPCHDHGAGVDDRRIGSGGSCVLAARRALGHRQRFAAQQRFVDQQVVRPQQPRIGRHSISLGQFDEVAAHDVHASQALAATIAPDQRAGAGHVVERFEHPLGPALLHQLGCHDHTEHGEQDARLGHVAQHQIDRHRRRQQLEHRLAGHLDRDAPGGPLRCPRQIVGAIGFEAAGGFPTGQACRRRLT